MVTLSVDAHPGNVEHGDMVTPTGLDDRPVFVHRLATVATIGDGGYSLFYRIAWLNSSRKCLVENGFSISAVTPASRA